MKKIIFFAIIMLAAVALALPQTASAAGAWADGTYTLGNGNVAASDSLYQLSSNVWLYYSADATNTSYGLGSLHKSGNRSFATSNNTTLIYWSERDVGTTADSNSEPTPGDTVFSGVAL